MKNNKILSISIFIVFVFCFTTMPSYTYAQGFNGGGGMGQKSQRNWGGKPNKKSWAQQQNQGGWGQQNNQQGMGKPHKGNWEQQNNRGFGKGNQQGFGQKQGMNRKQGKNRGQDMIKKLNLTDKQKERIKDIRKNYQSNFTTHKDQMKNKQKALAEGLKGNKSNDELRKLYNDMEKSKAEMDKKKFDHMLEMRSILTDEQREQFQGSSGFMQQGQGQNQGQEQRPQRQNNNWNQNGPGQGFGPGGQQGMQRPRWNQNSDSTEQ
ncbi:MAG: Spy/CpxP family protein refolding chaperone [bacterium]|nr:Spy/CpxP family protein refolding chaperone [bacterium]MBU1918334.1 Spy/CpxP family protein refolding chaperone [bacterium]